MTGTDQELAGTDEFIVRCEGVRAWNYMVRAEAQARLGQLMEPAGTTTLGAAKVWHTGERARVHLLDEVGLHHLDAIEAWLAERRLTATFDVLPVVACRAVASELGARGYRLIAWQPTLWRSLSTPIETREAPLGIEEVGPGHAEFVDTFMQGYEVPETEWARTAPLMEARWEAEGARRFLARLDGRPVAAATLVVFEGIARLANCATRSEARRSGAQTALIQARLRAAAAANLRFAVSDARQGGGSLRNLARAGFAVCAQITQWKQPAST